MAQKWRVIFNNMLADSGRIYIDDMELLYVTAVELLAEVDHPVELTIRVLPPALELEGVVAALKDSNIALEVEEIGEGSAPKLEEPLKIIN